jgi:hypothetical protein
MIELVGLTLLVIAAAGTLGFIAGRYSRSAPKDAPEAASPESHVERDTATGRFKRVLN